MLARGARRPPACRCFSPGLYAQTPERETGASSQHAMLFTVASKLLQSHSGYVQTHVQQICVQPPPCVSTQVQSQAVAVCVDSDKTCDVCSVVWCGVLCCCTG